MLRNPLEITLRSSKRSTGVAAALAAPEIVKAAPARNPLSTWVVDMRRKTEIRLPCLTRRDSSMDHRKEIFTARRDSAEALTTTADLRSMGMSSISCAGDRDQSSPPLIPARGSRGAGSRGPEENAGANRK